MAALLRPARARIDLNCTRRSLISGTNPNSILLTVCYVTPKIALTFQRAEYAREINPAAYGNRGASPNDRDNPAPSQSGKRKKFVTYHVGATEDSNVVTRLFFDRKGALWCASDEMYRARPDDPNHPEFEKAITRKGERRSFECLFDSRGRV